MAGLGVAAVGWPLINQMNPAADTLALGLEGAGVEANAGMSSPSFLHTLFAGSRTAALA